MNESPRKQVPKSSPKPPQPWRGTYSRKYANGALYPHLLALGDYASGDKPASPADVGYSMQQCRFSFASINRSDGHTNMGGLVIMHKSNNKPYTQKMPYNNLRRRELRLTNYPAELENTG